MRIFILNPIIIWREEKVTPLLIRNRLKTKMSGRWTEYGWSEGTKRSKDCKTESER